MRTFPTLIVAAGLFFFSTNTNASAELPAGGTWTVESATLPYGFYYGCAAYDPVSNRIYTAGGYNAYSNLGSTVQFYDVDSETTGVVSGSLWSPNTDYNANNCVVVDQKLWYATATQMCNFDLTTFTGTCAAGWYFPTASYGPAIIAEGHSIYVVSNYYSTWRFDIDAALQNNPPWTTLPNQNFYRYDYPGVALYNDHLYVLGGTYETTAVERLYVGPDGPGRGF